jgi:beta propeller repeat protein
MQSRTIAVLLTGVLLILFRDSSVAQNEPRGLGVRPPTAKEQAYVDAVYSQVSFVQPNDLARQRAWAEIAAALESGAPVPTSYTLPTAVDNSNLQYFPPIRSQGGQGSCTCWAACYYYDTYTQAMDEGLNVSGGNNDHIASPAFMYPLVNDGYDGGAYTAYAVARLSDVGCCSWTLKPYDQSDYTTWPAEAAWVEALERRTSGAYWIDASSGPGLDAVKQHLANGNVAVTDFDVYDNFYYTYPTNTNGVNNGVYYCPDGGALGGHAVTIVGYDDNKSYVDHRDGLTHHGAFLLANSWGTWWGVYNSTGAGTKGFFWVAYSAFAEYAFGPYIYYNDDRDNYRPTIYAVAGLNHAQRGMLAFSGGFGAGDPPATWQSQQALDYCGGASLPIDDAKRVAIDLSDGAPSITLPATAAVRLDVWSSASGSATISSADFYEDFDRDGTYVRISSTDPIVAVAAGAHGYARALIGSHEVTVTTSAPNPSIVRSGGTAALSASFFDTFGHAVATWAWDDGGAGGSFSPSAAVRNPSYAAPANSGTSNLTITLTVTATCSGPEPLAGSDSKQLTVLPEITGTERGVCVNSAAQYSPEIWGDRIVWSDTRMGNPDIYMKDLYAGVETAICANAAAQAAPHIWRNRIVWQDQRSGNWDIYMYDLAAGAETAICAAPGDQTSPVIWGDHIVWEDWRGGAGTADIYMYDLATHAETAICTGSADQRSPAIWGGRVVYGQDADIYMYDISTAAVTPICTHANDQYDPAIWGDRVVWMDERDGGDRDIYMYDLTTGTERSICTVPNSQYFAAIYGDRIVWQDYRNGEWDIYMYDLATGTESPICTYPGHQVNPAIWGNRVIWTDERNGGSANTDIYMRDLDPTWGESRITDLASDESSPDISDSHIVWHDDRGANWDVYMYDLATAAETLISGAAYDQWYPSVWGNRIVWEDWRNFNPDIYMLDLATGVEAPICTGPEGQCHPAVWGDRIVWEDARNGNYDIYMYDLATATETPICVAGGDQVSPAIWGDRIVWADERTGNFDIYMYDVATHIETPVCTAAYNQRAPAIWGDRIVWEDGRSGGTPDIYMYDLATHVETPVCTAPTEQWHPSISGDRVVWEDHRNFTTGADIYMRDLVTGAETIICAAPSYQVSPVICGDRIVWEDWRNGARDIYMYKLATCSFDDVVRTHPFWQHVEAICAKGVTSGTSATPPLYGPTGTVTRGQMAAFLCRAFNNPPTDDWSWYDPGAPTFADVPRGIDGIYSQPETDGTHPFYGYVERLYMRGVTSGIGDALYGATGGITRGQMATFLCKVAAKTWYNKPTATFADVPRGSNGTYDNPETDGTHPFYGWIERLADPGSWGTYGPPTQGTSPTTFSPAATCTRGQMAAFIQRAAELPLPVK